MLKAELEKIYLETTYSVFVDKEQYDIKVAKPVHPEIKKLISKEQSTAILTAWNPKSQVLSLTENQSRNNQLKLRLQNYTVFTAIGQGIDLSWSSEESFFILGITKIEADKLAIQFEQNAYVWFKSGKKASLIFTEYW